MDRLVKALLVVSILVWLALMGWFVWTWDMRFLGLGFLAALVVIMLTVFIGHLSVEAEKKAKRAAKQAQRAGD